MIYKNKKNNKYYFRVYVFDEELNKKVQVTRKGFLTRKEAEKVERDLIKQNEQSKSKTNIKERKRSAKKVMFKELFELFYYNEIQHLKESSINGLYPRLKKHILNYFENYALDEITPAIIQKWYSNLARVDLDYEYKNRILNYFKKMYRLAYIVYQEENKYIEVLQSFKNERVRNSIKIYSEKEFKLFISGSNDILTTACFSILFYSGLRLAELRGLTWRDVNFNKKYLNINKSLNRVEGGSKVMSPKTSKSVRKVYIPDNLLSILDDLKKEQINKLTFNDSWYVLGNNKPIYEKKIRIWNEELTNKSGLHHIRIHDFRHSYITMLYNKGMSFELIGKQVGHENILITINTYTHIEDKKLSEEIDKILN